MKKLTQKLGLGFLILIILGSMSLTSCKKAKAPVIPPASSFVLSGMDSTDNSEKVLFNFGVAAFNVGLWTAITQVAMAVPVAAYKKALEYDAKKVDDNKWLWEYSVGFGFNVYTARLYGTYTDNGVLWEMYLSLQDEYEDFLWYSGTQNEEGTAGQWIVYESPTQNRTLLQIDWTRNITDNTGTLKYTNIVPEGDQNGGYIYYGNDQETPYDAFFDIYNKGQDHLIEIEFNTTTLVGRIKYPYWFHDEIWHCWNENLMDDFCPNEAK